MNLKTEVKLSRAEKVSIFKDTCKIISDGKYVLNNSEVNIKQSVEQSIANTVLYKESEIIPTIEVVNEKTNQACMRLLSEGKQNIAALNFASGHSVGGSVLIGSSAQEEDLCRSSSLYQSLETKTDFYSKNSYDKIKYTDDIIYSPDVVFFKDDDFNLLESPFKVSVITSPAPNLRDVGDKINFDIEFVLRKRILKILRIAELNNHKNLVLGAWGCGAFYNDVNMVATIFKECLQLNPCFEHICFAVFDTVPGTTLYSTFKNIFQ